MPRRHTSQNNTHITFVGHATTLIEMGGTRILTDPLFRRRFRGLRRRHEVTPESMLLDQLDAVVLSHMHFDHMDYPSLRMIPRDVPIIAPEGAGRYLQRKLGHDVAEMRLGEMLEVGGIEIHATPSQHDSGFYWPMWFPKTVLSYVLVGPQTVYFVGDTALFDGMRDIGESFDIDVALLPVWGLGPYLRGDHMTPAEAARAVELLDPRVAVPIHWGTLTPMGPWWTRMPFLWHPPHAFSWEVSRRAPSTDVRVLHPGDCTQIAPDREPAVATEDGFAPVLEPALA